MELINLLIFACCNILVFGFVLFLLLQNLFSVPYVPSTKRGLSEIFHKYGVGPQSKFIDLGSGDGSVVLMASKIGARAHGIEINPVLVLISRTRNRLRRSDATFSTGSMFKTDLKDYTHIYAYLTPKYLLPVAEKILKESPQGTIVFSHTFRIAGWEEKLVEKIENRGVKVNVYRV